MTRFKRLILVYFKLYPRFMLRGNLDYVYAVSSKLLITNAFSVVMDSSLSKIISNSAKNALKTLSVLMDSIYH